MQFREFPKMARLSRDMIITEKIDGTNSSVCITNVAVDDLTEKEIVDSVQVGSAIYTLRVGSRNRWIVPSDDNHGFARWAKENSKELVAGLGEGTHFGEWWGQGIQRGYGLKEKRFSLFNAQRWSMWNEEPKQLKTEDPRVVKFQQQAPKCCHVIPILYSGPFDTATALREMVVLEQLGSVAAPGFMNPEGIVVWHVAGNVGFKKTLEKDELPKSLVNKK